MNERRWLQSSECNPVDQSTWIRNKCKAHMKWVKQIQNYTKKITMLRIFTKYQSVIGRCQIFQFLWLYIKHLYGMLNWVTSAYLNIGEYLWKNNVLFLMWQSFYVIEQNLFHIIFCPKITRHILINPEDCQTISFYSPDQTIQPR